MITANGVPTESGAPYEYTLSQPSTEVTVPTPFGRRAIGCILHTEAGDAVEPDWNCQSAYPFDVTARFADPGESGVLLIW